MLDALPATDRKWEWQKEDTDWRKGTANPHEYLYEVMPTPTTMNALWPTEEGVKVAPLKPTTEDMLLREMRSPGRSSASVVKDFSPHMMSSPNVAKRNETKRSETYHLINAFPRIDQMMRKKRKSWGGNTAWLLL